MKGMIIYEASRHKKRAHGQTETTIFRDDDESTVHTTHSSQTTVFTVHSHTQANDPGIEKLRFSGIPNTVA